MTLFAVFQEGVYRHGCEGIFTELDKAVARARDAINEEDDNYHSYDVVKMELGSPDEELVLTVTSKSADGRSARGGAGAVRPYVLTEKWADGWTEAGR